MSSFMLNQFVCVGRLLEINDNNIVVKIPRSYKNNEGIYEDDILKFMLIDSIKENVKNYCNVNSIIGIKGRIESINNEVQLKAEKITFLSSTKED